MCEKGEGIEAKLLRPAAAASTKQLPKHLLGDGLKEKKTSRERQNKHDEKKDTK